MLQNSYAVKLTLCDAHLKRAVARKLVVVVPKDDACN